MRHRCFRCLATLFFITLFFSCGKKKIEFHYLEFHYNETKQNCENDKGESGYNNDQVVECGSVENLSFNYKDFSNTNLMGLKSNNTFFTGCNFSNSDLSGAVFEKSDLSYANFSKAKLNSAQINVSMKNFYYPTLSDSEINGDTTLPISTHKAVTLGAHYNNNYRLVSQGTSPSNFWSYTLNNGSLMKNLPKELVSLIQTILKAS
ncbi:MAG: pentapeptide repeat-containing protein [Bdellovibrio sp.]|nr:pentapeptide repeat-containing protein [Bdellovibrio sp.]